ncbi:hypothetical protein [Mycoplasma tauri]|uniref:hypothetical protein n=1 Tax=Mycoplasma tauri TaxID=547987 RepID=UPI001CBFCAF7|nr:hypothetical protein [Mycoplasma tauri]MBZ4203763.1 hypothetical protein [Mycoplasma tauri]MBZ4218183.1 hypothetical protein [Mycoplasma tauri]MBZ4226839.1 hypothetical protein [Mycoplasma tauri]
MTNKFDINKQDNVKNKKTTFGIKIKHFLSNSFKFTPLELVISGVMFSLFIISFFILKVTGLGQFFGVEILFCVIFGIIFGSVKGSILAILADTFSLILNGQIGLWYWGYAIWPPIISIVSSIYFFFYKTNGNGKISSILIFILTAILSAFFIIKTADKEKIVPYLIFILFAISTICLFLYKTTGNGKIIASLLLILIAVGIMIFVFANNVKSSPEGTILIDRGKSSKPKTISLPWAITLAGVLIYSLGILVTFIIVVALYIKNKNQKYLDFILIIGIMTFIIILYRWIFGPIVYIKWAQHVQGKKWTVNDRYVFFAIPIIVNSMFTLPVYILVLSSLYPVIKMLKRNYLDLRSKVSY